MKAPLKYTLIAFAGFIALVVALAIWPYELVASPNVKLRVVDDSGRPLTGVRVTREWETSELRRGTNEAVTDTNGSVRFGRESERISMLERITKPLLILVPIAHGGPEWDMYGRSEFRIFRPDGYALKFDDGNWEKVSLVWQAPNGICIRDGPVQYRGESCIELYFYNKRHDFDFTLTLDRKNK